MDTPDAKINYDDAISYWASVPATVDGVLGGFGNSVIPKADIVGSTAFIKRVASHDSAPGNIKYALDVGAGIGRVTKNLLVKFCERTDILEPVQQFVDAARVELAQEIAEGKVGELMVRGLQDFEVVPSKYFIIWCQWCLGQVSDPVLIEFLRKCQDALQPGGVIVVKENLTRSTDDFDDTDSSVTRTDSKFRHLFAAAGLELFYSSLQRGFPKKVYPVRMYALRPAIGVPTTDVDMS